MFIVDIDNYHRCYFHATNDEEIKVLYLCSTKCVLFGMKVVLDERCVTLFHIHIMDVSFANVLPKLLVANC